MPRAGVPEQALQHLLYQGSVKDVYGEEGRDPYIFKFSDRYSIFDWGEMPDSIPGKGEALAVMGDLFFHNLARPWGAWKLPAAAPARLASSAALADLCAHGLEHHSLGLVNERGEFLPEGARSRNLAVKALARPAAPSSVVGGKVVFDYSAYARRPERCLVPLEVVFRFGAPEGSSFLGRAAGTPGYAESLGLAGPPRAGELFPFPIVEFFTKLEPSDRFLTRAEALQVGGLSADELRDLEDLTLLLALRLRDLFSPLGLELWDGKFEFAFTPGSRGRRGFLLVDSIGPDELRLLGTDGVHFSKEFLRREYRGSAWYGAMERAKELAKERGQKDWKKICRDELRASPEKLPPSALENARLMYPALVNGLAHAFLGRDLYPGIPSVAEMSARMGGTR